MMEIEVHDRQGGIVETMQFDETILGNEVNMELLHSAIVMHEANQRSGTASTKGVREIAGRGGKPFRQKGTGRARMGKTRRPGSRGGAPMHGPKPRDHSQTMPKRAKKEALKSALLGKFRDGEVVVVNELKQEEAKTKEIAATLTSLKIDRGCLVVTWQEDGKTDQNLWKSIRNIPDTDLSPLKDLNVYTVLHRKNLLMTKDALEALAREMK